MELLTPVLQYLSSRACQENLLKATTGFEGICNRCRIVHAKKRRVFLVNTPLGGNSSSHWRLKTLQIINFSCFGQVHGARLPWCKSQNSKIPLHSNGGKTETIQLPPKLLKTLQHPGIWPAAVHVRRKFAMYDHPFVATRIRKVLRCSLCFQDFCPESVNHKIQRQQVWL